MKEIQSTKNYELFKKMEGNRPLLKYHLRKLRESIEKDNRLNLHPIIVNKDFYVIDGQHRLEIAKQINAEIFFIQSDSIHESHIIECNVNQKSWEVENYIDYFAIKEKKGEYIELKKMLTSTGLKPKALLTLLLGIVSPDILDFLKTGKFKFPSTGDQQKILDLYLDFIAYTKDKRLKPYTMFTNHNFTRAFRWLFKTTNFQPESLFRKLDLRWFELKPQRSAEEWYIVLVGIYNFKNQNRLEEEYGTTK